jgi:hypothetical protein
MKKNTEDKIYFASDITERERACFEVGIKLGALYHILCGIPISEDQKIISSIEKGIESSISCQPYVKNVEINLNKDKIRGEKSNEFDYDEITGKIIRAKVLLEFESIKIMARIDWVSDLNYPLMYIEKINRI